MPKHSEAMKAIFTLRDPDRSLIESFLHQIEREVYPLPDKRDREMRLSYLVHSWGLVMTSPEIERLRSERWRGKPGEIVERRGVFFVRPNGIGSDIGEFSTRQDAEDFVAGVRR